MGIDHADQAIAIIGGGLTGLTAALCLQRLGQQVVVLEAADRVGGAIGSIRTQGWLQETGPNSLLEGAPEVAAFIDGLGLAKRRVYASVSAKKRYIVQQGKLVPMPASPLGFVRTPLFSYRAKLGILAEPFRKQGPADADESVRDFVLRRLGREFLDYAINPFVGGVYAGDPARLSVRYAFPKLHAIEREHGSLIRGAMKRRNTSGGPKGRIFSFPEGLQEIPNAIAARLNGSVTLGAFVTAVRRLEREWELDYAVGGVPQRRKFRAVVCALPATGLSKLHFENVPQSDGLASLREIEHPPVASVFLGFRREDIGHPLDGFGLLVPEVERGHILGTLFSSSMFEGRAPDGHAALTTFVGGMRQPHLALRDDKELIAIVKSELTRLVGVRGGPVYARICRWPKAIPQYEIGYGKFSDTISRVETATSGLFIGGNCRDGISLANCIASGERLAAAAQEFVRDRTVVQR